MSFLKPPPANILFIAVSRIGDTLFATPTIRAVAVAHPGTHITVLGHSKRAEVLEHLPFVYRVGTITKGRATWRGWLGGKFFDLAFVFGFDEALVAYALRVSKRVVAFEQENPSLNRRLFAVVTRPPFQSEHAVLRLLRLSAAVGIPPAGLRIAFQSTGEEIASARQRLEDAGILSNRPLVGLQVASFATKSYRDWPIENFAALCDCITSRWPQARFLIYGGSAERQRTGWLKQRLGERAALFAGNLSLRATAALMTLTDLYVGVDTGPTHIMSAFDIPLVALYHCISSSKLTGPLEHPCAYLIDHPAAGERCTEMAEMADIHVDTVFAEVERAMTEHPPSQR
jgi:heptosyltransferase-3